MTASDPDFLVLHALRLKGFADTPAVGALALIEQDDVTRRLEKAAADDLVTYRSGRISGWALTPAGRSRHRELLVDELERAGTRDQVEAAYRSFLTVNNELLEVCTAWQLRKGVLNDHTDETYDREVVARLGGVDDVVQPVCGELASALQRFTPYGPRLATARARVEAGDTDWFAKPMIDSYHTVWFEMHEDLLVTLGIERSKEVVS